MPDKLIMERTGQPRYQIFTKVFLGETVEDALDTIIKILGHELIFLINMDKCYVCGQNRSCCRQAMQDIVDSNHVKVVRPQR